MSTKLTKLIETLELLQNIYERNREFHQNLAKKENEEYHFAKSSSFFNFIGDLQWITKELKDIEFEESLNKL